MLIVYLFLYKPLAIKTDSHLIGSDFRIIFNQCENSKWTMKDKGKFERGPKVWFVGDVRSAMHTERSANDSHVNAPGKQENCLVCLLFGK